MAGRDDSGKYLKHAFLSQYNLILLGGTVLASLIDQSVFPLLMGVGAEAAYLSFVPGMAWFRRRVDAKYEEEARKKAREKREQLIRQMAEPHQQRLAQLQALNEKIKTNIANQGEVVRAILEESVGKAERLAARYVQLAIAHKSFGEYLRVTDRRALANEIVALEAAIKESSARVKELQEQRLGIAKKRAERWDKARENLEVVAHQLATIEELIRLMHEQSIAPKDPELMSADLDRFMADLDDNQDTVRELATLGGHEDEAAIDELELGRIAEQEARQQAGRR